MRGRWLGLLWGEKMGEVSGHHTLGTFRQARRGRLPPAHHLAGRDSRPWFQVVQGPAGSPGSPGPRGLRWGPGRTLGSSELGAWGLGRLQVGGSPQPRPGNLRPHSCQRPQGCRQAPLLLAAPAHLEGAGGLGVREQRCRIQDSQLQFPRAPMQLTGCGALENYRGDTTLGSGTCRLSTSAGSGADLSADGRSLRWHREAGDRETAGPLLVCGEVGRRGSRKAASTVCQRHLQQ